ncbi:hypothetical protein GCM10020000_37470 [Streptomyces olivoverticillatus]
MRQALRMRPDRLVVGEVRGPEVTDLLAALNTGHEGGCGTVHANAASDVPARLEALGSTAGLDRAALHSQLAAALSLVIHLVRDHSGRRRVAEVHVLDRDRAGFVTTVPAAVWGAEGFEQEAGWGPAGGAVRAQWRGVFHEPLGARCAGCALGHGNALCRGGGCRTADASRTRGAKGQAAARRGRGDRLRRPRDSAGHGGS